MSILYKLLIKEVLKYAGIILIVVLCIYLAVDFFEKIDNFIEAGLSVSNALLFLIYKIPFIINQVVPVCLLLSVLIIFGLMNRNNEIIALKSSGVSVYYLLKPILLIGVLSSIFIFFLSEQIVPAGMEKANNIWLRKVKKEPAVLSREKNIWIKGTRSISHIIYYNSDKKQISGMTRNFFDQDFRLIRRIDVRKAIFKKGEWILQDILEQVFDKTDENFIVKFHKKQTQNLGFMPQDLQRVVKKSEEMNFGEIRDYIKKVEQEGYDANRYRVDFYAKIAFPLVCILMILIGTGIALKGKTKDNMPISIAYGVGIAFLYWIFHSFCMSLGYGDILPPILAAWTGNLVFLCFGAFTLLGVE